MYRHPEVSLEEQGDGRWAVSLGDALVRKDLSHADAEKFLSWTPSELVKGTTYADAWFRRGVAAERVTGGRVRAEDVCDPIRSGPYTLDLFDLYARMCDIAQIQGNGTRLYRPRPGGREALKWLIEDLSGTPTDPAQTMPDNNAIRKAVHQRLQERGWAERLNQTSFVLLRDPEAETDRPSLEPLDQEGSLAGDEPSELGNAIVDVGSDDVAPDGLLRLGGLAWSEWHTLADASQVATTQPGVYLARSGHELVYVGMAGERRGMGVRGRLQIYWRGRGAVSGLGEAAFDRALADPAWLSERLASLTNDGPARAKEWAALALRHLGLEVCWTAAPDAETARVWETNVLLELEDATTLWNRARPTRSDT